MPENRFRQAVDLVAKLADSTLTDNEKRQLLQVLAGRAVEAHDHDHDDTKTPAGVGTAAKVSDVHRPADNAPAEDDADTNTLADNQPIAASGAPIETVDDWREVIQAAGGKGTGTHAYAKRRWREQYRADDYDDFADLVAKMNHDARAQIEEAEGVIQATSGICGPLQPRYEMDQPSGMDRTVMSMLPTVEANRGGLRVPQILTRYNMRAEEATGYEYTSADGAAGTTKPILTIDCPSISDFEMSAHVTRLKVGNFDRRFFPEHVAQVQSAALSEHAHRVSDALLADMQTQATDYDSGGALGASAIGVFVRQTTFHVGLLRETHGLDSGHVIDVFWPFRAHGAMVADLAPRRSTDPAKPGAFAINAMVAGLGRELGARIRFVDDLSPYIDSAGDYTDADDYPVLLAPVGSVIRMTAAELTFGEVVSTDLLAANATEIFTETFDGVAFTGLPLAELTNVTLCPTGQVADTATVTCSGAGS